MDVQGPQPAARRRIPELDGLRGLAILAVFASHAFRIRMLWMGVDLFFVLSGFLITGILLDMQHEHLGHFLREFYARRVRRILPAYVLFLALVSLVFGTVWMQHWYLYLGLTNYVMFFHNGLPTMALNPLWSLGVEEQFYGVWPLVVFFVARRRLPAILIAIICVVPFLRASAAPWLLHQHFDYYHWVVYRSTVFRMDCLATGSLLTLLWRRHSGWFRRHGAWGLIATGSTPPIMWLLSKYGTGFSTFAGSPQGNFVTYEMSLFAMTGLFLWGLSGRGTALLRTGPLAYMARVSFAFYLFHEGVLTWLEAHRTGMWTIAAIGFAVTMAMASASYYLLERPILRGGNRREARLEVAAAQPHGDAPHSIA